MVGRFFSACIRVIRPLLGPSSCRFCVSCTDYALEHLKSDPVYRALPKIIIRVLFCTPFTPARWIRWFENKY